MNRCILAGLFALLIGAAARAQQPASSFFSGVAATEIKNVPIDTSKAMVQNPGQSAMTNNRFDFPRLFHRLSPPAFPPKTGVSPLPPPASFPSTKYPNYKMVGQPPFLIKWMFGGNQNSPIQPARPYVPGIKPPVGPGS